MLIEIQKLLHLGYESIFLTSHLLYHIIKQELKYKCQLEVAYVNFHSSLLAWYSEDTKYFDRY